MQVIHEPNALRATITQCRVDGQRIAFVPTMGNLHAGHLALVSAAKTIADKVVVSIFVNPLQFGPNEDLAKYPRTMDKDLANLKEAQADLVFTPDVSTIYPHTPEQMTFVEVPGLGQILEGEFRPGFFRGVATVVAKLFHLVTPDLALFGEKDLQQLRVIQRMVIDLNLPIEIVGLPTVRETDGLAMSSRNQYLRSEERSQAAQIFHALQTAKAQLLAHFEQRKNILQHSIQELQRSGFSVQYFTLRHFETLNEATDDDRDLVLLTAAFLGETRLIDNLRVTRT